MAKNRNANQWLAMGREMGEKFVRKIKIIPRYGIVQDTTTTQTTINSGCSVIWNWMDNQ